MSNNTSGKVLLQGRFRDPDRRLIYAKSRLYTHQLVLTRIGWTGFHRQTIPLHHIERVNWWTGDDCLINLALYLRDDSAVKIWIKGAGIWKYQIEAQLGKRLSVVDELPRSIKPASAA